MAVTIINNLGEQNHGSRIRELIIEADAVTIASPYLRPDFAGYLDGLPWNHSKSLHLITTLVPKSEDQIKKIRSLHNLVVHAAKAKIGCQISLNNRLHGKVYVFQKGGAFTGAVISSANMTENGMRHLHEWGILLDEPAVAGQIHAQLLSAIEFRDINHADILEMFRQMKAYLAKTNPKTGKNIIGPRWPRQGASGYAVGQRNALLAEAYRLHAGARRS